MARSLKVIIFRSLRAGRSGPNSPYYQMDFWIPVKSGTLNVAANTSGPHYRGRWTPTLSLGSGTLNTGENVSSAATFLLQASAAQNAVVQVGNQIVTSPTNTVTNAINGVTLQLNDTGSQSTVSIAPDLTAQGANINAFVTAYNTAVSDIVTNTQSPTEAGGARARRRWRLARHAVRSSERARRPDTFPRWALPSTKLPGTCQFSQSSFEQSAASFNPTQVNQRRSPRSARH